MLGALTTPMGLGFASIVFLVALIPTSWVWRSIVILAAGAGYPLVRYSMELQAGHRDAALWIADQAAVPMGAGMALVALIACLLRALGYPVKAAPAAVVSVPPPSEPETAPVVDSEPSTPDVSMPPRPPHEIVIVVAALLVVLAWLFPPTYFCAADGCTAYEAAWRFGRFYGGNPVDVGRLILNAALAAVALGLLWLVLSRSHGSK